VATLLICLLVAVPIVGLAIIVLILRRRRTKEIISFVFLLRARRTMNLAHVRSAAEAAFGRSIGEGDVDAAYAVIPTERPGCFVVKTPEVILGLGSVDGTYVEDIGEAAERLRDFRCKKAIQEHRAWLAVDQIGDPPAGGAAVSYACIGKLLAELASDDCLALYCPETAQMNSYAPDLLPLLWGPNPLAAFEQPRPDEVVGVNEDDEEMKAAVAEAWRRWPEFVAAFNRRRAMQGFAVKVPFHEGQEAEYMWVEVSNLDGNTIHGNLVSKPAMVSDLKLNDKVTVSLDDLNDWIFSDGKQMVGGFTSKVLEGRQ
jgi:uncharacterized protein YegJ (DUF2314 family)